MGSSVPHLRKVQQLNWAQASIYGSVVRNITACKCFSLTIFILGVWFIRLFVVRWWYEKICIKICTYLHVVSVVTYCIGYIRTSFHWLGWSGICYPFFTLKATIWNKTKSSSGPEHVYDHYEKTTPNSKRSIRSAQFSGKKSFYRCCQPTHLPFHRLTTFSHFKFPFLIHRAMRTYMHRFHRI